MGKVNDPDGRPVEKGLLAFYYPGNETPWDKYCGCGFLGNFWDQGPGALQVEAPVQPGVLRSFSNTEAAFQALKFWVHHGSDFEPVSGGDAFKLKKKLAGKEDFSYGGYGSNWAGMLAVLRIKFQRGSDLAEQLLRTGESFLLEHNAVSGRDFVWSDNLRGDGTNWLGLQLMLIRDELRSPDSGTAPDGSWTQFIQRSYSINLETGKPPPDGNKREWM